MFERESDQGARIEGRPVVKSVPENISPWVSTKNIELSLYPGVQSGCPLYLGSLVGRHRTTEKAAGGIQGKLRTVIDSTFKQTIDQLSLDCGGRDDFKRIQYPNSSLPIYYRDAGKDGRVYFGIWPEQITQLRRVSVVLYGVCHVNQKHVLLQIFTKY